MLIASVQLEVTEKESKDERLTRVEKILDTLKGNDLIILPEMWNVGFFSFDSYYEESESLNGKTAERMSQKAKELKAYLLAGSMVEKDGDKYYNTSLFFGPKGDLLATYRKIHLFGYGSRETELLTPGEEVVVVPTEFGKFGITTCYDLRFPELYRNLADKGAEFFLITAAWPYPRLEHWTVLTQARSIENLTFLFSSNCCGVHNGTRYLGHSMMVDPWGTPIASGGIQETILKTEVDPEQVQKVRKDFPPFSDRVDFLNPKV